MLEKFMDMHILLYAMGAIGILGAIGMVTTHLTYRRRMKNTGHLSNLREKWLNLWKGRDRLLHRMNRLVWYPSVLCLCFLGAAVLIADIIHMEEGVSLSYLYLGLGIPAGLLLLRQGMDFSHREEMILDSLSDYIIQLQEWAEREPVTVVDQQTQDEVVERITRSIRETAASGSHFSKMLTPEEEELMREIIREFMP